MLSGQGPKSPVIGCPLCRRLARCYGSPVIAIGSLSLKRFQSLFPLSMQNMSNTMSVFSPTLGSLFMKFAINPPKKKIRFPESKTIGKEIQLRKHVLAIIATAIIFPFIIPTCHHSSSKINFSLSDLERSLPPRRVPWPLDLCVG